MTKNSKTLNLIGLCRKAGKITFGTTMVEDSIKSHKAKLVIMAVDSSEKSKKNMNLICDNYNVPFYEYSTIEDISKYIGERNKSVIGITDINFAKELIKRLEEGGED